MLIVIAIVSSVQEGYEGIGVPLPAGMILVYKACVSG